MYGRYPMPTKLALRTKLALQDCHKPRWRTLDCGGAVGLYACVVTMDGGSEGVALA